MAQFAYQSSYRRNLPHVQPPGATLFVTFCLNGSLPKEVVTQYAQERQRLMRLQLRTPSFYEEVRNDFEKRWFAKFESLLDGAQYGPQWLKQPAIAALVADKLHEYDGSFYDLWAFSIMPNHVHSLFKPLPICSAIDSQYHSLSSIMQLLKGSTSFNCNKLLRREGQFWQHESYDHYVRKQTEGHRILSYILNNPVKAGFVANWTMWKWNYCRIDLRR
jgi:putative transposase